MKGKLAASLLLAGYAGFLASLGVTLLFGDHHAMGAAPLGDGSVLERLWNFWYCRERVHQVAATAGLAEALRVALLEGYPPFGNVVDFWILAYPLDRLFPFPLSFNLQSVACLVLNGLAAAWLALEVTRSVPAALAAGVFFGLNPWMLALLASGYIREGLAVFPVLLARSLWRMLCRPRPREAVLAGCWLALSGILYWFYGLMSLLLVGLAWLWSALRRGAPALPLSHLLLIGVVAVSLALPFAQPYAEQVMRGQGLSETTYGLALPTPAEILAVPPGDRHRWHGVTSGSLHNLVLHTMPPDYLWNPQRRGGQPPWLIMLALVGAVLRPSRAAFWLLAGAAAYAFSLGPYLRTAAGFYPSEAAAWRMPYFYLFQYVPLFSRLFHPDRFALFTALALSVLGALALAAAGEKGTRRPEAWAATLTSLLLPGQLLAAAAFPPHLPDWQVPAFYRKVAADPAASLVELPLRPTMRALVEGSLIYQVVHGRPVWLADTPPHLPVGANPFFRWLVRLSRTEKVPPAPPPESAGELRRLGVTHLVLHEADCFRGEEPGARRYERMRQALEEVLGAPPLEYRERPPSLVHKPGLPPGGRYRMSVFPLPEAP